MTALDDTQDIIHKANKTYRIVEAKQKHIKKTLTESNHFFLLASFELGFNRSRGSTKP